MSNKTTMTGTNATTFQDFLDDNFNTVLSENGYDSLLTPFKKTDPSDLALFAGWKGSTDDVGFVTLLRGSMQIGAIVPLAAKQKEKTIARAPSRLRRSLRL